MKIENQKPLFLRACRQLTGLNAESFIHRHGFNKQAYLRLERRESYLREEMADKILKALELEGILVSKQWLLDGTGEPPKKIQKRDFVVHQNEIDIFKKRKKSFVISIKNDDMKPIYSRGDCVGGVFLNKKTLCHNKTCIVSFKDKTYVAHVLVLEQIIITITYKELIFEVMDVIREEEYKKLLLAPIVFIKKQKDESDYNCHDLDEDDFEERLFLEDVG